MRKRIERRANCALESFCRKARVCDVITSRRMTAALRAAAVVSMALMTAVPIVQHDVDDILLRGEMSARSVNQGVTWFWVAWACTWLGFTVPALAARHYLRGAFATVVALVGLDVVRIRMDFLASILDPDASGIAVYAVRFVAGWFVLYYLNFYRRVVKPDADSERAEKV